MQIFFCISYECDSEASSVGWRSAGDDIVDEEESGVCFISSHEEHPLSRTDVEHTVGDVVAVHCGECVHQIVGNVVECDS